VIDNDEGTVRLSHDDRDKTSLESPTRILMRQGLTSSGGKDPSEYNEIALS
jgi:hypothetical protein